jgi:trk system potassium uptake protein TrkA
MKFIIIGLGNFGAALGSKLTELGHEVVGVDNSETKVQALKDKLTHTICMDATDPVVAASLPIRDCDVLVVAIGEDFGASVLVTAIFKNLGVKRLIGRGISDLHTTVLEALDVHEIVTPEEESATRLAKSLDMKGVVDSLELSDKYSIIEVELPKRYRNMRIADTDIRTRFNLNIVTVRRTVVVPGIFGKREEGRILGVITPDMVLKEKDILVLFGTAKDQQRFMGND